MSDRRKQARSQPGSMRTLLVSACGLAIGFALTLSWSPDMTVEASNKTEPPIPAAAIRGQKRTKPVSGQKRHSRAASLSIEKSGAQARPKPNVVLPPLSCFDAVQIEKNRLCSNPKMHETSTIDWKFQAAVARFMRKKPVAASAFVAVDIETGAVRALISHEPGLNKTSREALSARAPAASVFKVVTSVALVKRGLNAESSVCSHGGARQISLAHLKDSPKYDRCETLARAFAFSRNSAFGKLSTKYLDTTSLSQAATSLGFNAPIPFSLPLEPSKVVIPKAKLARARTAAGFSNARMSPLHGALIAATIARGGTFPLPFLSHGNNGQPPVRVISQKVANNLQTLMKTTVRKGTGRRTLGRSAITSAAKSGTLSSHRNGKRHHNTWMVGYFPEKNPKIAFASLVVNEGVWHIRGGDLARAALDSYAALHPSFKRPAR